MKVVLAHLFAEVRAITGSGTLDGGDVCQSGVNGKHFFIGISERTNEDGARQLAGFLDQVGYTYALVDIRHINGLLHLKSGLASLGEGSLVVIEQLMHHEAFRAFDLIPVAPAEAYAANCIQVNGRVLIADGYPAFARTLTELGYDIVSLDMSEFQKMDGGLSCLSLRF
jgi:dimethylargininase